ncbi:TolC family protein [Oceanispirochaeta sp.]|jgi:outer membrane protein|uniref:TolC family protein n=1 Tax=Oceanispirochaeta sp. TaxID=2035350 RepID=UPI00263437ED|nr:TolC family protein [Oceanispirochaeta sp.]MDA3957671.1 TolC family protein [Oceanispirochaeta sp.]
MRNTQKIILLLTFICIGFPAVAQTLFLTEDDSVNLALKQNLSLQNSRIDLTLSQEQEQYSWNYLIPEIKASAGLSRTEQLLNNSSPEGSWGVTAGLDLSQSLNLSSFLARSRALLNLEYQNLSYESDLNTLSLNVRQEFYYLLAYSENLALQQKNLDLAKKRYDQSTTNFKNGLASKLDVLEARNSYESLRPDFTDAKTSYNTQLMSFNRLLGLDLNQGIELQGSLERTPLDLDADALVEECLSGRLDVQSGLKNIEIQESQLKSIKSGYLSPTLSLGAKWTNTQTDLSSDSAWNDSALFSLQLSFPINSYIKGSSEQLSISETKLSLEKLEIKLKETLEDGAQEIRSLIMELEGSKENIEIIQVSVLLAQENYEMVEAAFHSGTKELLDVEDAQNKLLSANLNLVLSRYSYISGLLKLENALNIPLQ